MFASTLRLEFWRWIDGKRWIQPESLDLKMGSFMSWFLIPSLAQAAAAAKEVSVGQTLSGLMVLSVMAGSLAMMVAWATRIRETGHALPVAQRGLLRVPAVLTFVAIGLSLLMLLMMALVSREDKIVPPVVPPPAGAAVESELLAVAPAQVDGSVDSLVPTESDGAVASSPENTATPENTASTGNLESTGSAKSDNVESAGGSDAPADAESVQEAGAEQPSDAEDAEDAGEAASAAAPKMTPEAMKNALVQTVVMDAFLFLVFGFVIFTASSRGRVYLTEKAVYISSTAVDAFRNARGFGSNSAWPDLDEDTAVPQRPEPSLLFPSPSADLPYNSPYDPPGDSSAPMSDVSAGAAGGGLSDEPFSFLTEFRYAGEVFLAAYLPTAILRIIIVLLTVGLLGEEPEQHPFLEMMKSDVGVTVLSLILLTAVFLAPLVEELQFRVVILGGIAQLGRPMMALTVSSILFAFAHGFPDSLALVPLAFALGYTYLRRRSYITVMMVHFLFNGFNMVLALLAML